MKHTGGPPVRLLASAAPVDGSTPSPPTASITIWPLTATPDGTGRWRVYNAFLPASGYLTYAESEDALRVKLGTAAAAWRDRAAMGKVCSPETMVGSRATRLRAASIRKANARRASENRLRKAFDSD